MAHLGASDDVPNPLLSPPGPRVFDQVRNSHRRAQIAEQAIKVRQLVEDLLSSDGTDG
jgi:hypothetical protein